MAHATIQHLIDLLHERQTPKKLLDGDQMNKSDRMDLMDSMSQEDQEIEYALKFFEEIRSKGTKYEKWTNEIKQLYNMWSVRLGRCALLNEIYSNARIDRQPTVLRHIKDCEDKLKQYGWCDYNNQWYQELLLVRNQNFGPSIEDMIGEYDWIFETELPHFRLLVVINDKKSSMSTNPTVFIPGAWELFWSPIDIDDQFWNDETGYILDDYLTFIENNQSDDIWEMEPSLLIVGALGDLKVRRSEMNPLIVNASKIVLMKSVVEHEYQLRFCLLHEDVNIFRNIQTPKELTEVLENRQFVGTDGLIAIIRHIPDENRTIILPTNLYSQELMDQMHPKFINNYYIYVDRRCC